jgi:glycopeptide antibiotics resistance protein
MKQFSRTLFFVYSLFLLWLILFKTSIDFPSVLFDYQSRSLNLVPFLGGITREMLENLVIFAPFGLLLGINFKIGFWYKLAIVFCLSLGAEVTQYVLAIGTSDITDVIMNTLGGLVGIVGYSLASRWTKTKKLDWVILVVIAVVLVLLLALRFLVFRVRY